MAATLLLNLDVADAFVSFANLLNRPLLHAFYRLDQTRMGEFYCAYDGLLKSNLPKLHSHFNALSLSHDLYLQEWIYTLYSRSLPIDLASRVWDVFCRDGDDFVFRVAVGMLLSRTLQLISILMNIFCLNILLNIDRNTENLRNSTA